MVDWVDKCLAVSDLATLGTLGSVCWTAGLYLCLPGARSGSRFTIVCCADSCVSVRQVFIFVIIL